MSSRDFSDNLQQQSRTIGLEKISQLLTLMNKQNEPIEDDAIIKWFMYAPLIDLHDTSIVLSGPTFVEPVDSDVYGLMGFRKSIADTISAYDLTHDDSNATLIEFIKPGDTEFKTGDYGLKYSGGARTVGTEYQTVDDHADLNPTDEIAVVGWIYVPSSATVGGTQYVVHKDDSQYWVGLTTKTNLRFSLTRGAGTVTIDITIPNDAWVSFGFSYDTTNGFRSYVNKTQALDATPTGAISVTATDLGLWGRAAGTALLETGIALAGIALYNDELNQTFMDSFHDDGILDHDTDASGLDEITFWPFIDSLQAMPDATAGMFIAT